MKSELKDLIKKNSPTAIIGSGGNINKIFSLSKVKEGKPLTYNVLKSYYRKLSRLTTAERIKQFKLNDDRADVVVPALDIYLSVMQWSKVNVIYVPKVGLVDGIIYSLYTALKNKQ
jgi:exopolyphosphatase/guanosine-5'-triphosphate,3'-diphosphate pyrophosphatase